MTIVALTPAGTAIVSPPTSNRATIFSGTGPGPVYSSTAFVTSIQTQSTYKPPIYFNTFGPGPVYSNTAFVDNIQTQSTYKPPIYFNTFGSGPVYSSTAFTDNIQTQSTYKPPVYFNTFSTSPIPPYTSTFLDNTISKLTYKPSILLDLFGPSQVAAYTSTFTENIFDVFATAKFNPISDFIGSASPIGPITTGFTDNTISKLTYKPSILLDLFGRSPIGPNTIGFSENLYNVFTIAKFGPVEQSFGRAPIIPVGTSQVDSVYKVSNAFYNFPKGTYDWLSATGSPIAGFGDDDLLATYKTWLDFNPERTNEKYGTQPVPGNASITSISENFFINNREILLTRYAPYSIGYGIAYPIIDYYSGRTTLNLRGNAPQPLFSISGDILASGKQYKIQFNTDVNEKFGQTSAAGATYIQIAKVTYQFWG